MGVQLSSELLSLSESNLLCAVSVSLSADWSLAGQGGPYSPEGAALGGYGLDGQAHLGLRTAGTAA